MWSSVDSVRAAAEAGECAPAKTGNSAAARAKAARDYQRGARTKPSPKRSCARLRALQPEGRKPASYQALAKQAHASAMRRGSADRRRGAAKAAHTRAIKSAA